jgi:A/G-specific adenine glycosylase
VQPFCAAYAAGEQHSLPVRSRPPRPQEQEVACAVVELDGLLLVERRPPDGLLASLWQFPTVELAPGETAAAAVVRHLQVTHHLTVIAGPESVRHTHVFTHRRWLLEGVGCSLPPGTGDVPSGTAAELPESRWVTPAELNDPHGLPLAGPHRRIWERWQAREGGAANS